VTCGDCFSRLDLQCLTACCLLDIAQALWEKDREIDMKDIDIQQREDRLHSVSQELNAVLLQVC
jgi:hypothetical protein